MPLRCMVRSKSDERGEMPTSTVFRLSPSTAEHGTGGVIRGDIKSRRPKDEVRIAVLCRVLWNGGVQRVAIAEVEELRARGYTCDLYFLRAIPSAVYSLPPRTKILERTPPGRLSPIRKFSRAVTSSFASHRGLDASVDLDLLWRFRRLALEYPVVVYTDQYAALLGIYLRLTRGRPYVMFLQEFFPRESRGFAARTMRPLASLLDFVSILIAPKIVTHSGQIVSRINKLVPERALLARLGAPSQDSQPIHPISRHRHVLSITVWDKGRHPELYLELARLLPEFHFTLAGMWAQSEYLAEFRRRAASVTNLEVTGTISEQRRLELLRKCPIYLRMGYSEAGPGMGGLEALASGRIVICNRELGLAEIITSGVDGFVVDHSDPTELADLLRRIDGMSQGEVNAISLAARQLAQGTSWKKHVDAIEEAVLFALDSRDRNHAAALPRELGRAEGTFGERR